MVFSSLLFMFLYFVVVLALYFLIPNRKYRNIVLCVCSLLFYGWGEPSFIVLMIFSILLNYTAGMLVERFRSNKKKCKAVLVSSIAVNLLLLGIFKYTGFIFDTLKSFLPILRSYATPIIPLPIGISFYTFQAMSYVIDVYRNDTTVQRNPVYFGTYVALFPQLIAGPIVRYKDIAAQLVDRRENIDDFASGVKLFTIGLAKKVLIANQMASLWQYLREGSATNGVLGSWTGLIAFSLQIYFDFCGYSEMAIGLGRMFGFEFLKNFNYPYISKSITEFWRRWHISLSTWFREYVYIPLGGNRKGLSRTLINTAIVWSLTGLWHGASWNFVLWGAYFGLIIMIEKLFLLKYLERIPKFLAHIYALLLVIFGWLLFDFTDTKQLGSFAASLFTGCGAGLISHEAFVYIIAYMPILIAAIIASTPLFKNLYDRYKGRAWCRWAEVVLILAALVLCTASLVAGGYNPFIYFKF
ncbi:MAG: MBOAT family protein [Christensenellaceae bacterium]|nr:MBOAT family protein [Christensenellaceae bacterium]